MRLTGESPTETQRPAREPRRTHWFFVSALVAVLAVVAGTWWETHPNVFPDYGNGAGITNRVGDPALFGLTFPVVRNRPGRIHILAVAPHLGSGPPGAAVTAMHCAGGNIGTARGRVRASCHTFGPAAGSTLIVGPGTHDQLILVVRSSHVGKVVVTGATVTYRDGVRFGRQHIGTATTATFTRSGFQARDAAR